MASQVSRRDVHTFGGFPCGWLVLAAIAAALLLCMTAVANADTYVWWELESSNCGAVAICQGQGKALTIEMPLVAPAGFYEFTLVMKMSNDAVSTRGLTGYRTNLWRGPVSTLSWASPPTPFGDEYTVGLLNPLSWSGTKSGTINVTEKIMNNYGRSRATGQLTLWAGNSPKEWVRFTLKIDRAVLVYNEQFYVYQSVAAGRFASGSPNMIRFGPNNAVSGTTVVDTWAEASATLPVIKWIAGGMLPPDSDCDLTFDGLDNCPWVFNPWQEDTDGDGIGDACDPCPTRKPGDVSGNGVVDLNDIAPFVTVLLDPAAANPVDRCAAAVNGGSSPDGRDIQIFIQLLLGT
jgi:hypothetical protein